MRWATVATEAGAKGLWRDRRRVRRRQLGRSGDARDGARAVEAGAEVAAEGLGCAVARRGAA